MCFLAADKKLQTVHQCCRALFEFQRGGIAGRAEMSREPGGAKAFGEERKKRYSLRFRGTSRDVIQRHGLVKVVQFQDPSDRAISEVCITRGGGGLVV